MWKKREGKYSCSTEGENKLRQKGGASLTEGETHSEPMHSNIYSEAHVLPLRASFESQQLPALSRLVLQVDEGSHLDHSGRSGDVGSS